MKIRYIIIFILAFSCSDIKTRIDLDYLLISGSVSEIIDNYDLFKKNLRIKRLTFEKDTIYDEQINNIKINLNALESTSLLLKQEVNIYIDSRNNDWIFYQYELDENFLSSSIQGVLYLNKNLKVINLQQISLGEITKIEVLNDSLNIVTISKTII